MRPKGSAEVLAERRRRALKLVDQGLSLNAGERPELWAPARVAEVIAREFGVQYHPDHVGRLLHNLEFSCQKPDRKALERDEQEIERWKRGEWTRIKKEQRT